jgi:hypothetical protein
LLVLTYLLRVLEPEDRDRFAIMTAILPRRLAKPTNQFLSLLVRCERASAETMG